MSTTGSVGAVVSVAAKPLVTVSKQVDERQMPRPVLAVASKTANGLAISLDDQKEGELKEKSKDLFGFLVQYQALRVLHKNTQGAFKATLDTLRNDSEIGLGNWKRHLSSLEEQVESE
jgi:hypothetical protein